MATKNPNTKNPNQPEPRLISYEPQKITGATLQSTVGAALAKGKAQVDASKSG